MMSIAQVRSAGSAGNYYTDKDNYYLGPTCARTDTLTPSSYCCH